MWDEIGQTELGAFVGDPYEMLLRRLAGDLNPDRVRTLLTDSQASLFTLLALLDQRRMAALELIGGASEWPAVLDDLSEHARVAALASDLAQQLEVLRSVAQVVAALSTAPGEWFDRQLFELSGAIGARVNDTVYQTNQAREAALSMQRDLERPNAAPPGTCNGGTSTFRTAMISAAGGFVAYRILDSIFGGK